jgi:hypothetical protein
VLILGAWSIGVVMVWTDPSPDPSPGAAMGGLLAGLGLIAWAAMTRG